MIQGRVFTEKDSRGNMHSQDAVWRQDDSFACPCPGQISPLTTISIVKDFLLRQGMDNESWRVTNVKDLHLPSACVAGTRYNSARLRAVSVPLTSTNERKTLNEIRDIVTRSNEATAEGKGEKAEKLSLNKGEEKGERRLVTNDVDRKGALKAEAWVASRRKAFSDNGDLFTFPTNRKSYKSLSKNKTKIINENRRLAIPKLFVVRNETASPGSTNVTKLCDFIDEKYLFERPKTNLTIKGDDKSIENKERLQSAKDSTKSLNLRCRHKVGRSSEPKRDEDVLSRGAQSCNGKERHDHQNIFLEVGKQTRPMERCEASGTNETQKVDFEEKVARFNETSPLISGFNKRYPNVRISLKYLVNHLNHKRLVKKFYGVVDSQRLNANFTPANVLQSGGNTINGRIQYRRIKWLAAATDALESEKGGKIGKND